MFKETLFEIPKKLETTKCLFRMDWINKYSNGHKGYFRGDGDGCTTL